MPGKLIVKATGAQFQKWIIPILPTEKLCTNFNLIGEILLVLGPASPCTVILMISNNLKFGLLPKVGKPLGQISCSYIVSNFQDGVKLLEAPAVAPSQKINLLNEQSEIVNCS